MANSNPLARCGGLTYLLIAARDPAVSAKFYGDVLGWKIDQRQQDDFRFSDDLATTPGRGSAGGGAELEATRIDCRPSLHGPA